MRREDERNALRRLFAELSILLKHSGFSLEEIQELFATTFEETALPATPGYVEDDPGYVEDDRSLTSDEILFFGRILGLWTEDVAYLTELGEPLPLATSGPRPCLTSLIDDTKRLFGESCDYLTTENIIEIFTKHGSVELNNEGKFVLKTVIFRTRSESANYVAPQIDFIADFAGTVAFNTFNKEGGIPQVVAKANNVPYEAILRVRGMLDDEGVILIKNVDAVLEGGAKKVRGQAGDRYVAGVGMYLIERLQKESQ